MNAGLRRTEKRGPHTDPLALQFQCSSWQLREESQNIMQQFLFVICNASLFFFNKKTAYHISLISFPDTFFLQHYDGNKRASNLKTDDGDKG
jgi:hypothetical protein